MALIASPFSNPELYTFILLDGKKSPGLCKRSSGGEVAQQAQDMFAPGFDGGTTVFRFGEISKIEYQFWVRDHQGYLQLEIWIAELIRGSKARPPKAYKFVDRFLKSQGIGVAAVLSAGPIQQPEAGALHFFAPVRWTEYRPLKPIGGPVSPKPQDDIDKLIKGQDLTITSLEEQLKAARATYQKTGGKAP